jgi:hypothetical protein
MNGMEEDNMNKAVTVNQLLKNLQELKKKGYGDAQIFITDDEECNGYHALWYVGSPAPEMDKDEREYSEENNSDISILEDRDMAVYMG